MIVLRLYTSKRQEIGSVKEKDALRDLNIPTQPFHLYQKLKKYEKAISDHRFVGRRDN